jgi:hypothetical protein
MKRKRRWWDSQNGWTSPKLLRLLINYNLSNEKATIRSSDA